MTCSWRPIIVVVDVRDECAVAVALGACAPAPSIGRSIASILPSRRRRVVVVRMRRRVRRRVSTVVDEAKTRVDATQTTPRRGVTPEPAW